MAEEELDELFRRFVQKRDVAAIGALFDAAAPQLARIAWHLTHDANGVEDLVQATFLTALGSARQFDVERRVMPWLLGILVNHARSARRVAGRKPEVLAADVVDTRTPEAELERREVREVVERAVAELPDTYREVVSTWLIEGATPTEIAHRTGKPAATVRVQLRRGLELLRNGLPAGVAGLLAPNGWPAGSFAASREVVVAQAARVASTLAPTSTLVSGGWLIGAAAIVAAVGVGWFAQRDRARPAIVATAPVVSASESQGSAPIAAAEPEARNDVAAAPVSNARDAVATPAAGWWLIGDVEGASATDEAHLTSPTGNDWSARVSGAHFELEVPAIFEAFHSGSRGANEFTVRYDSPRFLPTHAQVNLPEHVDLDAAYTSRRVELHLELAPQLAPLVITGRIAAVNEFEATSTIVALCSFRGDGNLDATPDEEVHCSSDGSFRVRGSSAGAHALLAVRIGLRPATRRIDAGRSGIVDLGAITLERGEHLTGTVDPRGGARAVSAAKSDSLRGPQIQEFLAPGPFPQPRIDWDGATFEWASVRVVADARATFEITGLAAAEYRLRVDVARADERNESIPGLYCSDGSEGVPIVASRDGVLLEQTRCGIRIDVRAGGVPADGASVALSLAKGSFGQCGTQGHLCDVAWSTGRPASVTVSKDGWAPHTVVIEPQEAVPGAVRVIELAQHQEAAALVLRPIVPCSVSDDVFGIDLVALDAASEVTFGQPISKTASVLEREWRFEGLGPGRYRIDTTPDSVATAWCVAPRLEVSLAPGETQTLDFPFETGGRLAITVRGAVADSAVVRIGGSDQPLQWKFFDERLGRVQQILAVNGTLPIGARAEITNVFPVGTRSVRVALLDGRSRERERTVDIVPGQTTELVVDFSRPDER